MTSSLWQCFDLYRRETGIHVNRLVDADFDRIFRYYQQRNDASENRSIPSGADIKQRLELIGCVFDRLQDARNGQTQNSDKFVN
jgi:hypothetical protein